MWTENQKLVAKKIGAQNLTWMKARPEISRTPQPQGCLSYGCGPGRAAGPRCGGQCLAFGRTRSRHKTADFLDRVAVVQEWLPRPGQGAEDKSSRGSGSQTATASFTEHLRTEKAIVGQNSWDGKTLKQLDVFNSMNQDRYSGTKSERYTKKVRHIITTGTDATDRKRE